MVKLCSKCKESKEIVEFYMVKGQVSFYCKMCQREVMNLSRKGRKEGLVQKFGGVCSCCKENKKEFLRYYKLFTKVLCFNCFQGEKIFKLCPHEWIRPTPEEFGSFLGGFVNLVG